MHKHISKKSLEPSLSMFRTLKNFEFTFARNDNFGLSRLRCQKCCGFRHSQFSSAGDIYLLHRFPYSRTYEKRVQNQLKSTFTCTFAFLQRAVANQFRQISSQRALYQSYHAIRSAQCNSRTVNQSQWCCCLFQMYIYLLSLMFLFSFLCV